MKFQSKTLPNCLACALKPMLNFSSWLGMPCLTITCVHNQKKIKIKISFSKLHFFIAMLIVTFLLIVFVCCLYGLKESFMQKNDITVLGYKFTQSLYCLRSAVQMLFLISKSKTAEGILETIYYNTESWKFTNSEIILKRSYIDRLRVKTILCKLLMLFFLMVYGFYLYSADLNSQWTIAIKMAAFLCFFADFCSILLNYVMTDVLRTLFYELQNHLRKRMSLRTTVKDKLESDYFKKNRSKLDDYLIQMRRSYTIFIWVTRRWNKLCNPNYLYWAACGLLMMVTNGFIVLICLMGLVYRYNHIVPPGFIGLDLQLKVSCLLLLYSIYQADDLRTVVSLVNLLLFSLVKYNSSPLKTILSSQSKLLNILIYQNS